MEHLRGFASPTRGEVREGDSSLTEESGSDSDSGSSSEPDDESGPELESPAGPKVSSESPLTCLLRGICLLFRGHRLIGSKIF